MGTLKFCIALSVILCRLYVFAFTPAVVISNLESAIISNIESSYGSDGKLNSKKLWNLVHDVIPRDGREELTAHKETEDCSTLVLQAACNLEQNITACQNTISEKCKGSSFPWGIYATSEKDVQLKDVLPALAYQIHSTNENDGEDYEMSASRKSSQGAVWGYGIGFSVLLGLISMEGSCMFPCMKRRFFQRILMYCVGLGVGTMACAGTLVLIPEALGLTGADSPYPNYHFKMSACLGGLYVFYLCKRIKASWTTAKRAESKKKKSLFEQIIAASDNIILGDEVCNIQDPLSTAHAQTDAIQQKRAKHGEVATVAWVILFGDAFHKFIDGVSVGAAFTESLFAGISVSLAVICEEMPHELGDIALLLNSGMSARKAFIYNELVVIPSFVGVTMGILLGENTDASTWILAVAGGIFIYISFVDMLPEMGEQATKAIENGSENPAVILLLQNLGLLTGFVIIFLLAHFGGEIEHLIN